MFFVVWNIVLFLMFGGRMLSMVGLMLINIIMIFVIDVDVFNYGWIWGLNNL